MEKKIDIHAEHHRINRNSWLRASVMGANDGIVSVSSLMLGFIAAGTPRAAIVLAGTAGLVSGALSMAAGEYVSVQSQKDTEKADLAMEARELEINFDHELAELREIYIDRGLKPETAQDVAQQLMAHDALGAHARDEMGLHEITRAQPFLAAWSSAASFSVGAGLPLLTALFVPDSTMMVAVVVMTLISLGLLGGLAARAGGASMLRGAARVLFWGVAAMGATAFIGNLIGYHV
ncbi:VIT family protein [Guyparkeria sp. SCN-R1]|uniref:VIT1/CCC1 transporter family protein n=1 Tax=Guyparkeria sp. SCN-R1 TaxID=2341113 RepID=UPI000F654FF6|nr:VIT family protein [Guyparkeria sp. SCN-R1]RRQ24551.1 VIT family protein [Guyparkeria sp. SCN-R1]